MCDRLEKRRQIAFRILRRLFLTVSFFFIFSILNNGSIFANNAYVFTGKKNVSIDTIDSIPVNNLSFDEQQVVAFAVLSRYQTQTDSTVSFYNKLENSEDWQSAVSPYLKFSQSTKVSQLKLLAQKGNLVAGRLLQIEEYSPDKSDSFSFLGPAMNSAIQANQLLLKPASTALELQKVIELLQLSLTDLGDLPFGQQLLHGLPLKLSQNGLPLEAAILARALQRQKANRTIEKNVADFLVLVGDFKGALKAKEALDPMLYRNSNTAIEAMSWSILGKDYKGAFDIHSKYLSNSKPSGVDTWTGLSISRDFLRVRSAGLLELLGNSKEALLSLENLTRDRQFDSDTGYARLMQSQLLFEDKLNLAEQVAEDITFRAQESDHYRLEFFATVLDGLALQRQGKDYLAWINFTK
ncbi:MAG: hypothetical protein H3C43_14010, partial [Leptonema sp. (in: Bacteria)]|nr:hypothetical protein [Leptonema sp. (in: bacteria)]